MHHSVLLSNEDEWHENIDICRKMDGDTWLKLVREWRQPGRAQSLHSHRLSITELCTGLGTSEDALLPSTITKWETQKRNEKKRNDKSDNSLRLGIISPFNLLLAVGLLYITFIMFRYVPYIPDLSKTFIMMGCCILSNVFSASTEMIMWGFFFVCLYGGLH